MVDKKPEILSGQSANIFSDVAEVRHMTPIRPEGSNFWVVRWFGNMNADVPVELRGRWTSERLCQVAIDKWNETLGKLPAYQRSRDRAKKNS